MLVGLLRGVNVGGKNRVPMAQLRSALTAAGLDEVATYLQSGNVIAHHGDRGEFERIVHDTIAAEFGLDIPVIVRSSSELASVLEWNPFPEPAETSPRLVHVSFLVDPPDRSTLDRLDALDSGGDTWAIKGLELVVSYGSAMHDSPLARGIARLFGSGFTARNWSTVAALAEMARERR